MHSVGTCNDHAGAVICVELFLAEMYWIVMEQTPEGIWPSQRKGSCGSPVNIEVEDKSSISLTI